MITSLTVTHFIIPIAAGAVAVAIWSFLRKTPVAESEQRTPLHDTHEHGQRDADFRAIASLLELNADTITTSADSRRKLLKDLRAGKVDQAIRVLMDADEETRLFHRLHEQLDHIIIRHFPEILPSPDAHAPYSARIRIEALARLGFEPQTIAKILNLSVRTVYNNRTGKAS